MIETINVVNREVSKTLGMNETLVKFINQFYWRKGVKEAIQSGQHTSVRIKNIGTLVTSRMKVNNKIVKLIRANRELNNPERVFKEKTKKEYLDEKYKELRLMLARRNDIAKAYKTNKDRINQKYELRKTSLGQSPPDSTSDSCKTLFDE